jgi:hypothetical protein
MIEHDRLFKELLTEFFGDFVDLFLPELAGYLDKASLVFLDKEIFTDVTSGTALEADLVVSARESGQFLMFSYQLTLSRADSFARLPPQSLAKQRNNAPIR